MKRTKLMSKLFSSECSDEFREKVLSGIDEAREKGEYHCVDGDCDLHFADVNGDVIVEDQENDNEVTRFSENPEDENDLVMEAVDVQKELSDTEDKPEEPEDKPEEPEDKPEEPEDKPEEPEDKPEEPEDKPEEPEDKPEEPEDKEFSELIPAVTINVLDGPDGDHADDIVDDLNVDVETGVLCNEKSGTKKYSLNFKNFSESKARKIVKLFSEVIDQVNEMVDSAEDTDEPEVKTECDKTMSIKFGKKGIRIFSDVEDMDKPEGPEEPEEPKKDSRTFSEPEEKPKVTVQIENLEPASVASLLKPAGVGEERPKMDEDSELEPKNDPNGEGFSRQFSFTGNKKSINPLLFVEIK